MDLPVSTQRLLAIMFIGLALGGLVFLIDLPDGDGPSEPGPTDERVFVKPNVSYVTYMDEWVAEYSDLEYPPNTTVISEWRDRNTTWLRMLRDGSADAGIVSTTQFPRIQEFNPLLRLVAGVYWPDTMFGLYAQDGIDSVEDLRGGRIAIAPIFPGSLAKLALVQRGLNTSDYETVPVPPAASHRRLAAGDVDAALIDQDEPAGTHLLFHPQQDIEEEYGGRIFLSLIVAQEGREGFARDMADTLNETYPVARQFVDQIAADYQEETGENLTRSFERYAQSSIHMVGEDAQDRHQRVLDDLARYGIFDVSQVQGPGDN